MIPTPLKEKLYIVTKEYTEDDYGIRTESWTRVKKLGCNILSLTNNEFVANYSTEQSNIVSFRVLYNKFTKELLWNTKGYTVEYNGHYFNIETAIDYKQLHIYVDLKCVCNL